MSRPARGRAGARDRRRGHVPAGRRRRGRRTAAARSAPPGGRPPACPACRDRARRCPDLLRHHTAADIADERHDRVADLDAAAEPLVLLMRPDAVDLEQHAKTTPVNRARHAGLLPQPLERAVGDQRHRAAAGAPVDRAALRPQERQRLPRVVRERLLPRPRNRTGRVRLAVHLRLDGLARLDDPFHLAAVREREDELSRRLVPRGMHAQQLRALLVVHEPAVAVDEPEAAVAGDAGVPELHLVGIDDVQRLDGRDRDADDLAFHVRKPSYEGGSRTSTTSPPRRTPLPSSSKIQKLRPVTWTATL